MLTTHCPCASSSVRLFLAAVSLMAVLLLLPVAAEAGSYSVAYTGGAAPTMTSDADDSNLKPTLQSGFSSASQGGEASATASPRSGGANSFTLQANPGPTDITVTFTWVPASGQTQATDPPPACVLVEQSVTARWYVRSVGGTGSGTGTADCGLPGAVTTSYMISSNCPAVDSSAGYWQVLSSPGASFSRSFRPSASFAGDTGAEGSVAGHVEIGCGAAASPVALTLTGTTPDSSGSENILIGQRCSASLSCNAPGVTFSNFQWRVSGQVFGAFQVAADQSWGYASNLFPDPDWIRANPQWCWSKDENVTVSYTAQASFSGTPIGTVTGQKQVKVWAPYYYFGNDTGSVFIDGSTTGNYPLGARYLPNVSIRGSNWQGRVSVPALFSTAGIGTWRYLQIITPGRRKSLYTGDPVNCTENGNRGLDTSYPYPADPATDPFTAVSGAGSVNDAWPDNDTLHQTGDSPRTVLIDAIFNASVDESFEVYMMYKPAGSASQWVPLHKFSWRWYADDNIPLPSGSWASWVNAPSAGYVARSSSERCYDHPFWQKLEGVFVGSGW